MYTQEQSWRNSPVRFSVVITCHNQQEFIADAIDSVLAQRHRSCQVIVVDDGSNDGSLEILKRYDDSLELISLGSSQGALRARNHGASRARGEYLIFLDGDDLLAPWALQIHDQLIAQCQPATILAGARWFTGAVPELSEKDVPRLVRYVEYESLMSRDRPSGWFTGGFVMLRQSFMEAGGWSSEIFHLDLMDLAAKLRTSGTSVLLCSPYTMLYRMHSSNSVHDVASFISAAHRLMERDRQGCYPAWYRRIDRLAWYAGMIVCWSKRGMRAGLYKQSAELLIAGIPNLVAALLRGLMVRIEGRRPVRNLPLVPLNRASQSLAHETSIELARP